MKTELDSRGGEEPDPYLDLLKRTLTASIYEESAWHVIEAHPLEKKAKHSIIWKAKAVMRSALVNRLRKRSIMLVRKNRFVAATREMGGDWPCFGFTMIGHRRLENLEKCIKEVIRNNVPGDFIETGAWRGGATIFMRAALRAYGITDRTVWVADSFEGMPIPQNEADGWDFSTVEQLSVSLDQVKANFAKFGLLDDRVRFLKGWFKDTLPTAPIQRLAILRLDGDLYHSTMDAISNLYQKVSKGGFVIVDDYYGWEGCRRAIQEYRDRNRIQAPLRDIDTESVYWKVE
jgi:O-methyltransferase